MTMRSLSDIEATARQALAAAGHAAVAGAAAKACAFLEGVGYPGLKLLQEALADGDTTLNLERDALGLDLKNVSCVFIGDAVARDVEANGRCFLRNVRHGLYLLPRSVEANYGIGCPVDPSFALGGERLKNPYAEKLAAAAQNGVAVDDGLWAALTGAA
ncbi:MAG: DUF3726 domain-containing protein [Proteobacteria bacterium]|nr:DUF3726 domain-containing protein [Pseudomonadota bacterium]